MKLVGNSNSLSFWSDLVPRNKVSPVSTKFRYWLTKIFATVCPILILRVAAEFKFLNKGSLFVFRVKYLDTEALFKNWLRHPYTPFRCWFQKPSHFAPSHTQNGADPI